MDTIAVRECSSDTWRVERGASVLHESTSQDSAYQWALKEADRSFDRGERVQVIVAPVRLS